MCWPQCSARWAALHPARPGRHGTRAKLVLTGRLVDLTEVILNPRLRPPARPRPGRDRGRAAIDAARLAQRAQKAWRCWPVISPRVRARWSMPQGRGARGDGSVRTAARALRYLGPAAALAARCCWRTRRGRPGGDLRYDLILGLHGRSSWMSVTDGGPDFGPAQGSTSAPSAPSGSSRRPTERHDAALAHTL